MPASNKTSMNLTPEVRMLLADLAEVLGLSQSATIDVALVSLAQRVGLRSSAERRPPSAGAPGEPHVPRPTPRRKPSK